MNIKEGFSNFSRFYQVAFKLSSHLPVFFNNRLFDEINLKGELVPPEKRKHMDILQEFMFYFFRFYFPQFFFLSFLKIQKMPPFL